MFTPQEHAFKTFNKDLKEGTIASVLVFYGVEEYLIEWAANAIIKKTVDPSMIEMDLVKLDDDASISQIIDACDTFSMFSNKRVVWVKNLPILKNMRAKGYTSDDSDRLLKYSSQPNEGTILILSSPEIDEKSNLIKGLREYARFYDFATLDEPTLLGFIDKRFKSENAVISRENLKFFITESGYLNKESDYRILNIVNDVSKIVAHASGSEISEDDIVKTLDGDVETFVFDFLDALSTNKKETAFKMLHNILSSGSDIFSILGVLINHFELMLEVAEFKQDGMNQFQMKDVLKIHEYRIKKAMNFADRFSLAKLREILISLYEVDRKVKTGEMDQNLALELIVANV